MLKNKTMDRICCLAVAVMVLASVLLWGVVEPVQGDGSHAVGYEDLLFDSGTVHTIDITIDDWDSVIANAAAEEYADCNITIDGETYKHVGIRAKGNTSLSSVATLGSTRYSFKVEFNHYTKGMTYHGLDKLSLNNLIQDATMMKDYLAYTLMGRMGVPSSLCSYVQINVNGEPWGLYLAVEGVEDAFQERNGMTKGELYKPDSLSFGGGRGNGGDFDIEQFRVDEDSETAGEAGTDSASAANNTETAQTGQNADDAGSFGGSSGMPGGTDGTQQAAQNGGFAASAGNSAQEGFTPSDGGSMQIPEGMSPPAGGPQAAGDAGQGMPEMPGGGGFGGFNFGMGSNDVKLVYSDDNPDSYSNIFNNAKTKINTRDKTRLIETLRKLNAQEDLDSVVNKEEVTAYLAVHNFLCNDDSYTGMMVHNYYLYEEKGKLSIVPWDYNLAFGGFAASTDATSTVNSPIDSPVSGGTTDSRPLIAWIFSDEDALARYHEVYDRFITENIESGWLAEEISRVQAMITPYLEKDESAFYTMDEFSKAVETLQTFCAKRGESIRGQLEGTIPSTSAEQQKATTLIDASEISTADMGSMNSTNGGGGFGGGPGGEMPSGMPDMSQGGFTMPAGMPGGTGTEGDGGSFGGSTGTGAQPETSVQPETSAQPEASAQPAESTQPAAGAQPGGGFPGGGNFPGGDFMGTTQADRTGQWIWTAACAALLLAAILIIRRAGNHNN